MKKWKTGKTYVLKDQERFLNSSPYNKDLLEIIGENHFLIQSVDIDGYIEHIVLADEYIKLPFYLTPSEREFFKRVK